MSQWPSIKAKRLLAALFGLGWRVKRQSGSHRTLSREGWPDVVFAFHDGEEIGPRMLALIAIFARPTSASIPFADIEALMKALGGSVSEREGSRVKIELKGEQWRCHRPHPGKEAKRYQVEEARELLDRVGVMP